MLVSQKKYKADQKVITFFISGCPFSGKHTSNIVGSQFRRTIESPDPETTTPNGCTCNSICGATVDDGFKLDWCKVRI